MSPTSRLLLEVLEDRCLLAGGGLLTAAQIASVSCVAALTEPSHSREQLGPVGESASRDRTQLTALSRSAAPVRSGSQPGRDQEASPWSIVVSPGEFQPTSSFSGGQDSDDDASRDADLVLLGEAALTLVSAQRSLPCSLAQGEPVLPNQPPAREKPLAPLTILPPPPPAITLAPPPQASSPVRDETRGPSPSPPPPGRTQQPEAVVEQPETPRAERAGERDLLPPLEGGLPLVGLAAFDLKKIEEGVDRFFTRLSELGGCRDLRWSLGLTSWLLLTTAAGVELSRARTRRLSRPGAVDSALPGEAHLLLGEER